MGGRGRDRAAAKSKVAWLAAAHAATRRSRGPAAAQSKARLPARSCCQLGPERSRAPHGGQSEAADRGASGACPTSPICPTSVPLPLPHLGATQVQLKRTSDKRGWPSHHLAVLVRRLRPSEGTFDAVPPVDEDNVAPWKRDRLVETATRPWHCLSSAPAQGALGGSGWLGALRGRGRPTGRPATALAARATAASKAADPTAPSHRRLDAEPLENIERVLAGPAQRLPPPKGEELGSAHAAMPPRPRPHRESRPLAVVASHAEGEALALSRRNSTGYKGVVSRGAGFALQKSALARAGLPAAAAVLSFETATAAALHLVRAAKAAHAAAAPPATAAAAAAAAVHGEGSAAVATPGEGGYAANDAPHPAASVRPVASGAAAAGGRAGARRGRRALRVGDTVEVEVEDAGEARLRPRVESAPVPPHLYPL